MSTFALTEATDDYETKPVYQRKFGDGDMVWLADEYKKISPMLRYVLKQTLSRLLKLNKVVSDLAAKRKQKTGRVSPQS